MPVRLTEAQYKALRTPATDPPKKAGRAPRKPVPWAAPPKPERLIGVKIAAPQVAGGFWTVTVEYTGCYVTLNYLDEQEARRWKLLVESDFQLLPN